MVRTFKRASAAYAAAGPDQPILRIGGPDGFKLYVVGLDEGSSIELAAPERVAPGCRAAQRYIQGTVTLGHLDRLGNANGAAAAEYRRGWRIWQGWGRIEKFVNPEHAAQCAADRAARDAA